MSIEACAGIVRRGDPDRFLSVMAAGAHQRAALFAIYAFNLEVARAPWVSSEAAICDMRLQWWCDILAAIETGRAIAPHEVATPLSGVLDETGARILAVVPQARRKDLEPRPFDNTDTLWAYLENTAGALMWAAARATGAQTGEAAIRDYGAAAGLANWFLAVPALIARGRSPLPGDAPGEGREEIIADLARQGILRMRQARRALPKQAHAATRSGWLAARVLHSAAATPAAVSGGALHISEFSKKLRLLGRVALNAP